MWLEESFSLPAGICPITFFSIKRVGLRTLKKFVCRTKFVKGTAILVSKAYLTGRFVFDDSKREAIFFYKKSASRLES